MTEELTITERAEEYAKKLYHYLKTEQMQTFENHREKSEVKELGFALQVDINGTGTLHYYYIDENEMLIRKSKKV